MRHPASAARFFFAVRKRVMDLVRPTGNQQPGYAPSPAMNWFSDALG